MNHTTPQDAASNGRDSNGRFTKGNAGGPGNPFARQMARFRKELMVAVTDEDVHDIAKRFVDMAKGGSVPAAKFLFSYIIGKPTAPAVEPDKLDVHEWDVFTETSAMQKNLPSILGSPHPEFTLSTLRLSREGLAEKCRAGVLANIEEQNRLEREKGKRKKRRKKSRRAGCTARNGKRAPSTNGGSHAGANTGPARPGSGLQTPSTNGFLQSSAPSTNGFLQSSAPSTNGFCKPAHR